MRSATVFAGVAAVVVCVILVSAFVFMFPSAPGGGGTSSNSGSTTSSLGAGNRTFIATFESTMVRCCSTTTQASTSESASAATSASSTGVQTGPGGTYTYTPSSQVKIVSVSATVSGGSGGPQTVSFTVVAENIGADNVTVLTGGGSGLNSTVLSGGSYVSAVPSVRCEIAVAMVPVGPGGTWTSTTPGCWSGYYYQLRQDGTVQVQLTLSWSGAAPGSTVIDAEFAL